MLLVSGSTYPNIYKGVKILYNDIYINPLYSLLILSIDKYFLTTKQQVK